MTSIPEPPPSSAGASGVTPSLETGLAALKQGNYSAAIAHLEGICEIELHEPSLLRAQMGLVVAYERIGKAEKAIALCQTLSKSEKSQVKQWARRTLADLQARFSQKKSVSPQALQPSNPTAFQSSPAPTSSEADANPTGFVPLDNLPPASEAGANPTGFVPLDNLPPASEAGANPTGFVPLDNLPVKPRQSLPKAVPPPPPPSYRRSANPPALPNQETQPSAGGGRKEEGEKELLPTPTPQIQDYQPSWRNAGRAQNWKPLRDPKQWRLWLLQGATVFLMLVVIRAVVHFGMSSINDILVKLPSMSPIQAFYYDQTQSILMILLALLILSPWLLDGLLELFYGQKPLSVKALETHSPEAAKMLKRICWKKKWPWPTLKVLPINAPVALSYGNLPRTARIVVSQGLLDQLADDEIAAIYAGELGHIANWDLALMSVAVLVVQIPYLIYWQAADWEERGQRLIQSPFLSAVFGGTMAVISSLAYGIYWVFRWPAFWLSRQRLYYSDRVATQTTGNPNGLTRALLKIAIGIASDVGKQRSTSYLLEGFDLLMPVGCRQAITLGSCYPLTPIEPLLEWDRSNPYRQWLTINNAHPPLGDRLNILALYARFWKLETELDLPVPEPAAKKGKKKPVSPAIQNSPLKSKDLLLQGAPYFGVLIGLIFGAVFWLLGWVGVQLRIPEISWVLRDHQWLLTGLVLTGFCLGTVMRINSFFPDIKPANLSKESSLPALLANPAALPVDSLPVRLEGKLLGRKGIGNWLGQDLILQTSAGFVKLHYLSKFGPIGNLWPHSPRPSDFVNKQVIATGWFRRGATPWLDLETLSTTAGQTSHSGHPIWSTILAGVAALWGAYLISRGGL
ncbi:MAG: M48 family metalloprotease [Microcoleus vaginatus WJT46-NPBG5]|jgi:Zn-dependent protease with chaperone function|nr:M48 family metalloprotease [Microcoleus vaginatus WJT46-NPBG5]